MSIESGIGNPGLAWSQSSGLAIVASQLGLIKTTPQFIGQPFIRETPTMMSLTVHDPRLLTTLGEAHLEACSDEACAPSPADSPMAH